MLSLKIHSQYSFNITVIDSNFDILNWYFFETKTLLDNSQPPFAFRQLPNGQW